MMRPRVIPVLLLKGEGLYKGVQFKDYKYVGDPINAVRIFNDKDVDELFFIDITATAEGRFISPDIVQRVADESYMPFGVGGGIRTVEQIRQLLKAGAEKVSMNSAAIENPELIKAASELAGRQSVTVAIDVKRNWLGRYHVYTHSGARRTNLDPLEWALKAEKLGAGEILVNSIDCDGTGKGYDLEITRKLADAVNIPVIACGGAGKYSDCVDAIERGHASAAAAGSLFVFVGPHRSVLINYPDEAIWVKA